MDSDLLNVRDEILQLINKGKYLFTLEWKRTLELLKKH
jgi:hypothetical protein